MTCRSSNSQKSIILKHGSKHWRLRLIGFVYSRIGSGKTASASEYLRKSKGSFCTLFSITRIIIIATKELGPRSFAINVLTALSSRVQRESRKRNTAVVLLGHIALSTVAAMLLNLKSRDYTQHQQGDNKCTMQTGDPSRRVTRR